MLCYTPDGSNNKSGFNSHFRRFCLAIVAELEFRAVWISVSTYRTASIKIYCMHSLRHARTTFLSRHSFPFNPTDEDSYPCFADLFCFWYRKLAWARYPAEDDSSSPDCGWLLPRLCQTTRGVMQGNSVPSQRSSGRILDRQLLDRAGIASVWRVELGRRVRCHYSRRMRCGHQGSGPLESDYSNSSENTCGSFALRHA